MGRQEDKSKSGSDPILLSLHLRVHFGLLRAGEQLVDTLALPHIQQVITTSLK